MGAHVVVFTTTNAKLAEASKLGVDAVLEDDAEALEFHASSFDFMLSTVPQRHDLNPFLPLLKRDYTLVVVGALEAMAPVNNQQVAFHRRSISGSLIGSIAETQEVIDFSLSLRHRHGVSRRGIVPNKLTAVR
jgi:alcohol dehydrogenase (NADP+)